ncbi:mucin-2-like isoform X9 [Cylas formicarius]|uniref:mucin-2-like isoform X9 n=1 Tax=Cylas formicarius TaxID=197179 RepID=UPI002958DD8F|nr:mucin-2-like isoform X9 [Cylas formicarius]
MKILHLLLLFFFALQISGQRTRAPPADQGTNGAERTTQPRGRGRTRFSATQEYSDTSDLSDSGRRANSRARTATNANRATTINGNRASTTSGTRSSSNGLTSSRTSNFNGNRVSTNTGSRSSERRSRPTEQPTGYAVQEILNESPIDSFRRQSRPRVLTESRFDPVIPPRRTTTESVELVRDEAVEEFVSTFGSTARAILSARGEVPPPPPSRTTTPKIDEEYLSTFGDAVRSLVPAKVTTSRVDDEYLNSFGNTIRSIAASRGAVVASGRASPSRTINRNEVQQQRATPLRSETPILNEEDIPLQKPSLRDPLPSLRGSDSDLTQTQSLRSSSRNRGQDRIQEAGTNDRYEPQRRVALDSIEDVRYEPERRVVEEPANVKYQPPSEVLEQGLVDLKEEITGINSGEAPIEEISVEEEPQIITPLKPTEPPQSRRVQQVGGQRSNTRGRTVEYESQPATIQRSRSSLNRANQRAETASNVQVSRGRGARRRYEDVSAAESKTRGPSIFTEEEYQVVNTRSRTGRRIGADLEKSIDLSPTTTRSRTSGRRATTAKSGGRYTNVDYGVKSVTGSKELPTISSRRSKLVSKDDLTTPSRRNNIASGVSVTNTQSRSRLGDITTINEDRLEVLPLFDRESRVVAPSSRTRGGSSRRQNSVNDSFQASATENDMRFVQKPSSAVTRVSVSMTQSVEPRTPPTTRAATRRIPTTPSVPVTARPTTSTLRTTITTTTAKPTTRRAPLIKESVIAEYNEVTSKSTITRRKKGDKLKTEPNTSRGYKKSNSKGTVGNKKISEEDVDEEENYPAAFKALIQAKKIDGGVGKPSQSESSHIVGNAKSVVTSSLPKSSTASRTVTAEAAGTRKGLQAENFHENEIDSETKFSPATPSSTGRPTRNRQLTKAADKKRKLTSSTVQTASVNNNKRKYTRQPPSENHPKRKQLRSTAVPPSTTPIPASKIDTRVPAKFVKKDSSSTYARNGQNDTRNPTGDLEPAKPTIPFKKFNKYSSRYRNELTARSNQLKSTTNAPFYVPTIPTPAYVPTVPTITPPITTVPLRERRRHRGDVLELEAITFDDPVNTIASASLVSEEPRSVDNTIKLTPLVKDGTTEKPVSIIERIINSITSISTTPSPNVTTAAVTKTADDNESSAILKLAPKKSNVKDKTRQDDKQNSSVIESLTSEKPTTIIEKILSSLSAIQTNEVGTSNFNTVSSSSTTPLSAATKFSAKYRVSSVGITTTTLPAHLPISTSVNPLNVFDEIDENQVLEKRTIGKLLDILNGLASGKTSQKLVVVTPKTVHSGTTFSDKELSTYPITFVTGAPQSQEPLEALPVSAISDDFALVGNDLPSVNIDAPSSTEFVDRNEMSRMNMNPLALTSTPRPSTSSQSVSTVIINPTILPPNTPTPPIVAPTSTKGEEISLAASTTTTESTQVTTEVSPAVTSTQSQTTSRPTIPPTLSELLNGKTLEALDNIIKTDPSSPKKPNYETLTVNKYNEVLNIQDLLNKNNRGKPVKKESSQSDTLTQTSTQRQIAPFTSPLVTTEQWFSFPTTEQATSSELASTFAPTTNRISETTITTERIPEVTTTESTTKSISTTTTTTQPSSASTTVEPRIRATTPLATIIPSTILPTLFSTLFPTLVRGTTNPPLSSTKAFSTTTDYDDKYEVLSFAGTTVQPTTVAPTITSSPLSQGISTTTQPTTTSTEPTTTTVRTTTPKKATTTAKTESSATVPTDFAKAVKLKELTAEQRKNLEEIAKLEKQQAELLRQLNFLTSVFGGPSLKMPNAANAGGSGLANRVINMAVARDKTRSTTTPSTKRTTKRPNSIQDQLSAVQDSPSGNETATLEEIFKQLNLTGLTSTTPASTKTTPSLEEILKQYNLTGVSTPEPLTSTYGKSDEAILATLLKEQGIGPSTPKALADQIKEAGATTKASKPKPKSRPRTTTQRPGRLMQGLNWLLDLLDPPTTRRPATRKPASRKPKPKTTTTTEGATKVPEKETSEEELLSHQPTRITPVVTTAPNEIMTKPELSQSEIRALIKQLEAIQRNPKSSDQLDFSKIKSLQNLLDVKDGVEVISPGQHGTTLRGVNTASGKPKEVKRVPVKSTTVVPFSVSNKIEDEESLPTSTVSSTAIPPVRLNPVVGIDDDPSDPFIRSNLITAAVGVTRAISNFFGTAFQDAAVQVRHMISSGTNALSNISGGSNIPSVASASAALNPSG